MARADLKIDHVIICVPDLNRAAESFSKRYGLESVAGGRHGGLGTANRIIPLGDNYLELLTVVDRRAARANPFGMWATVMIEESAMRPAGLCLRTDDIRVVASRLGLKPVPMSRTTADGVELRWQSVGMEQTLTRGHPFFIQWDIDMADHPGRLLAGQGPIEQVTLSGRSDELRSWLGTDDGLSIVEGPPGIDSVTIEMPSGSVELN
jgi:hypothetical protein